jgi:hypothetical protein
MLTIEMLTAKIDRELRSIHQELSLSRKTGKTTTTNDPLLAEYLQLTTTDGIIPAIQYIILDSLSKHFDLYQDDRERSQILAATSGELELSSDSEILVSIQIVQHTHPLIYEVSKGQLSLTQERAISKMTGLKISPLQPTSTKVEPVLVTQVSPQTIPIKKESPTKLLIGVSMGIAAVTFGIILSNSFNKQVTSSPVSNNSSSNSPSVTISQNRPSPDQFVIDHYQALNRRDYDLTWDNLSDNFKRESGKSSALARTEYEKWWNSVSSVNLQQAETANISSDRNRATVNYRFGFTMNTGRFVQDKHNLIFLVWSQEKGKWLIDKRT